MKFQRSLLILSNITIIFPLIAHSYYGIFSRYLADDFCTAGQFKAQGFIHSMLFWRLTWSGRYSFYFFINITHWIGQWITPYLTAITIVVWLSVLYLLMREVLQIIQVSNARLPTLFLASIILFSTLSGTPDIYQSLYWQTGLVTYVSPLLLLTVYGVLFLNKISNDTQTSWKEMALSTGITFIAGGFSETYATVQFVALLAFVVMVYLLVNGKARRSGLLFLNSGLVGAGVALILIVTAPGNAGRMSFMPTRLAFPELVYLSLSHTFFFTKISFYNNPIPSLMALLAPALLALYLPIKKNPDDPSTIKQSNKVISLLVGIPILVYLFIAGVMAPSYYATADHPPDRALITAQFILILAFTSWSLLLGIFYRWRFRKTTLHSPLILFFILVFLIAGTIISSQQILGGLPDAQMYASLWDARDLNIRQDIASGAAEISAASLPHISPGLAELSIDPGDWVNRCLASTYGLSKVTGK
jgi:hypothetical protein